MATVHHLTRRDARRIAVRAQLLARERPADLRSLVRHLTLLQWSPTRAVAHSHHLVAWSRLGSSYDPGELTAALDDGHLDRLQLAGPLPKEDLPDTCAEPWRSSGWSDGRNLTKLLDMMVGRGEIALVGLPGRGKEYDLAERVYPDDPVVGLVEGVRGEWRVQPSLLDATGEQSDDSFAGRTALLSPLDRLVSDRKRLDELFEFDYQLEMYKPAANRKWGYWALPILHGDRFVGKLDASADRDRGALVVHAIHDDVAFTPDLAAAVDAEINELARWLDLERVDE